MSRPRTPPAAPPSSEGETGDRTVPGPKGRQAVNIPRIELVVEREAGKPAERTVVLNGDHFLIGAHKRNDLQLSDPLVSRFHCRLTRSKEAWRVTDAGSRNGTLVAGIRVRDADLTPPECRIVLGASVVRVRELSPTYAAELPLSPDLGSLCGKSMPMRQLFERIERIARSESDVLIEGESGAGKELIARELARCSKRADRPFVIVDCGAISPSLIESELFGYVRGSSFTGAQTSRMGAFEEADTGILLLDEIGELPLDMQQKLLRAIADREVRRLGENQKRKVDVRVFASTNRSLEREVNQKRFRSDLYFRLAVVTLRAPPLRDRLEDIPLLVRAFLAGLGLEEEKAGLFTPEMIEEMKRYDWPGNVRELKNQVERRVVSGGSGVDLVVPEDDPRGSLERRIDAAMELEGPPVDLEAPFTASKDKIIEAFEKRYLTALLAWADGNVSRAAKKAKMDRMHLHRLLHRYGIRRGVSLND